MIRFERTWPAFVLAFALLALLGRASCAETGGEGPTSRSAYDPRAYYALVNEEVVPRLQFCPLFADPRLLGALGGDDDRAAAIELFESELAPSAPWQAEARQSVSACDCGDRRLSALFCIAPDTSDLVADRIRRYALLSPLGADLETIDRWSYEAEGQAPPKLELRVGARAQRLPGGATVSRFEGDILYRKSRARFALVDRAGNEYVLSAGTEPSQPSIERWTERQSKSLAGAPVERRYETLPLRLHHGNDVLRIQQLADVDDRVLVVAQQSRQLEVSIDGAPIDTGSRTIFTLEPDQRLQLHAKADESLDLRLATRRLGELSTLQHTENGSERRTDAEAGADDIVRGLVSALDRVVFELGQGFVECASEGLVAKGFRAEDVLPLARADLWLTLDQVLQTAANAALRDYAEKGPLARMRDLRFDGEMWRSGDRLATPPHLTLTVLDADAGELLAMASYPDDAAIRSQLERVATVEAEPRHLLRRHLRDELVRSPLQLRPHAIGSLFKPLFAYAAGTADPQLLGFTVPKNHATDWRSDPRQNRVLEQCMISARQDAKDESHFKRAYSSVGTRGSCSGAADNGQEDVCLAIAVSDTYWFLELGARVLAREHGRKLPPPGTAIEARDEAYGLSELCGAQRLRKQTLCGSGRDRGPVEILPVACGERNKGPFCRIKDVLGVQLQAIGGSNAPTDAREFLGELPDLVERLAASCRDCCPAMRPGSYDVNRLFRWILPMPPQWSSDLLQSCAPEFEVFLEGGGVNYWNDVSLVRALGRLFTGNKKLDARLVAHVQPAGDTSATESACKATAPGRSTAKSCANASDPRCMVLRGMDLAVDIGTLKALAPSEAALAEGRNVKVNLRGKTGTTRVEYPDFVQVRVEGELRWERRLVRRKALFTTLLLEVELPDGSARHFVVLLSIEGAGDEVKKDVFLTSVGGAVPFFTPKYPGSAVLDQLVAHALHTECEP